MSNFKVALTLFKIPTNVMMVIEFIMFLALQYSSILKRSLREFVYQKTKKAFFSEKRFSYQGTVTEVHIHKFIDCNLLTVKPPNIFEIISVS